MAADEDTARCGGAAVVTTVCVSAAGCLICCCRTLCSLLSSPGIPPQPARCKPYVLRPDIAEIRVYGPSDYGHALYNHTPPPPPPSLLA